MFAVGSDDKNIYLFKSSEDNGLIKLGQYTTNDAVGSSPCALGNNMFAVGSDDKNIYLLKVIE
jgi:hypothetical protein